MFLTPLLPILLLPLALAAPCTPERKLLRRAWHTLTPSERTSYLSAELCLQSLPPQTPYPHPASRFEDLTTSHQVQATNVHTNGFFLAFHRYMMSAHETLLRTECGYTGAQPYWDEPAEAGKFTESEIFDPIIGFGGDGVGAERCVADGPFANYTLHVGPGVRNEQHCLTRRISNGASLGSSAANVEACLSLPTFLEAWPCLERFPHIGGHAGVGGELVDPISSPGDPLFYLHHSWLDKLWWEWQKRGLPGRLEEIAGPTVPGGSVTVTLDMEMSMFEIVPNVTVRDVMDIGGETLCFDYIDS